MPSPKKGHAPVSLTPAAIGPGGFRHILLSLNDQVKVAVSSFPHIALKLHPVVPNGPRHLQ
jgi:hypothetical protein